MLSWHEKILDKLFRPRPPRPAGNEASVAEIATVIVQFIRATDQMNGLFGRNGVVSFVQHHELGRASLSVNAGKLSGYFEPLARPLAPDFRFDFSEDHEGTISFSVWGDFRYEGFHLNGSLTPPAAADPKNWPIPRFVVSAQPGVRSPVTRHAKRLRDLFVSEYGAANYDAMFRST